VGREPWPTAWSGHRLKRSSTAPERCPIGSAQTKPVRIVAAAQAPAALSRWVCHEPTENGARRVATAAKQRKPQSWLTCCSTAPAFSGRRRNPQSIEEDSFGRQYGCQDRDVYGQPEARCEDRHRRAVHKTAQCRFLLKAAAASSNTTGADRVIGLKKWYTRAAHCRAGHESSMSSWTSFGSSQGMS
jgi:hypothetical protein